MTAMTFDSQVEREGYRRQGHWRGRRLHELAEETIEDRPQLLVSTAAESAALTQLMAASEQLAAQLAETGIERGARVFLLVGDPLGDIALLLALSRLDAIVFFSPPGGIRNESARMLRRSAAVAVATGPDGVDDALGIAGDEVAVLAADWTTGAVRRHARIVPTAGDPGPETRIDPLTRYVTFTSGTTGEPKGIQHNADTFAYAGRWAVELAEPAEGAVLGVIAIAHAAGIAFSLFSALAHRRDLAFHTGRWDPARVVDLIELRGATYVLCTPTHLLDIVNEMAARPARAWALTASVGGAPVPGSLVERCSAIDVTACRIFGLSECVGHTSTRGSDPLELRVATEGRPYPGTRDVSLAPTGAELGEGVTGEAGCRGPSLFFGYLGEDGIEPRLTDSGFFPTGDLVRVDDGRLTVIGRSKDIVIRGGENIDPVEVEGLLLRLEAIERTAVFGVPDDRLGERLAAAVEPARGELVTIEMIQSHLERVGVPKFKWPERLEVLEQLPVTRVGKIDKASIRDAMLG